MGIPHTKDTSTYEIFTIDDMLDNDWQNSIDVYLENPVGMTDRKIKYRDMSYVILRNELFKKNSEGIILKCLSKSEAYLAISKVHMGSCGSHQADHKIKWLLFRLELYWLIMLKGCIDFAKRMPRIPNSIVKPRPFRGLALDIIGEVKHSSSRGHRYILVGIDYFTKWIEEVPLPNIDQE